MKDNELVRRENATANGCDDQAVYVPEDCGGNSVQQQDFFQKLDSSLDRMNQIVIGGQNIMTTYAEMKMQIASVEAQVDAFCASLETDLAKYQQRLPMLEKQLDRASDRIDKFVEKILSEDGDNTSPECLQRQSILLDALTNMSNQFNTIIMKLL